jgi:predicted dehydrogenase
VATRRSAPSRVRSPRPVVFLGCAHPHADGRANRVARAGGALAGAFDDDPKTAAAFAARHATRALDSVEAALRAAKGGLAVVEGRNRRNAELARQAIGAGVAVLLEKPGAHEPATLRRLARHAAARKAWVQVGYHMRYGPTIAPALAIAKSGALGKVTTGRFHAAVQKPWLTNEWFCDPEDMGGLVFLDFCHVLDLLVLLLGEPGEVTCRTKKLPKLADHPFEDSAALVVEFGDALVAGDVCGWETNDWVDTWDVQLFGTEGSLVVGLHPPRMRFWSPVAVGADHRGLARGWTELHHESFDGEENYERELRDVLARLDAEEPPRGCTLDQAVVVVDALARAYASAGRKSARAARR